MKKLYVTFTKNHIEIRGGEGKIEEINMGIPYNFDTQFGPSNLSGFLGNLGFDVEVKDERLP